MPDHNSHFPDFDWRLTNFEGACREQLRRWAQLPLESILLAIEEMEEIAQQVGTVPAAKSEEYAKYESVQEPPVGDGTRDTDHDAELPGCTLHLPDDR